MLNKVLIQCQAAAAARKKKYMKIKSSNSKITCKRKAKSISRKWNSKKNLKSWRNNLMRCKSVKLRTWNRFKRRMITLNQSLKVKIRVMMMLITLNWQKRLLSSKVAQTIPAVNLIIKIKGLPFRKNLNSRLLKECLAWITLSHQKI